MKKLLNFILNIIDWFFTRQCLCCGKFEEYICTNCFKEKKIRICNCFVCENKENNILFKNCKKCRENLLIDGIMSLFRYKDEKIREIIYLFKYKYAFKVGIFLGKKLGEMLENFNFNFSNFIIIPIPMSKIKFNKRGFNQSFILGLEVSKMLKIKIYDNILYRKGNTERQAVLNETERHDNLKDVFYINQLSFDENELKNKDVLLVDDVITTGNTVSYCAKILKIAGIKKVFVITIART